MNDQAGNKPIQTEGEIRRYTVVIPALNEAGELEASIASIHDQKRNAEIIVVDGGSVDTTVDIARSLGVVVVQSEANRGHQLNTGLRAAKGDIILFLHGDTRLPGNAFELIDRYFANSETQIATFRLGFDRSHWLLTLYGWFTRFDSLFTRFGDQCIVVRREFMHRVGPFPEWPLFEDVELLRRARKKTRIHSLPGRVKTAARRFSKNGLLRQQLRNGYYVLLYLLGVAPESIARRYCRPRRPQSSCALILFARYPEPGKVKTRLARTIGKRRATEFYSICAQKVFSECKKLPMAAYLFYTDTDNADAMRAWVGWEFNLRSQNGNDLGERIQRAFRHVLDLGFRKAVIIGTDVPDLRADMIRKAEKHLDQNDVVIGPCPDGGYYLLGMKTLHTELFREISWSTAAVFDQTMDRAREQSLSCAVLPELADIDTQEELIRWSQADQNHDDNPVALFAVELQQAFAIEQRLNPGESQP